jgi:hypothetical protein
MSKRKPKPKNYDPLPPTPRGPEYFLKALRRWGVGLTVQGDRVMAHGANVSPVLQAEVAKRSRDLIALLGSNNDPQWSGICDRHGMIYMGETGLRCPLCKQELIPF